MVTSVPPWLLPDVGATVSGPTTASADGVKTGSVSARIIRKADPNLMNLRLNMCSPLEGFLRFLLTGESCAQHIGHQCIGPARGTVFESLITSPDPNLMNLRLNIHS